MIAAVIVFAAVAWQAAAPARAQDWESAPPQAQEEEQSPETAAGLTDDEVARALGSLRADDAGVRSDAADLLGLRGYAHRDQLTEPLVALLGDQDPVVRASALRALGRLRIREGLPAYVRALRDPAPDVRLTAAAALWRVPAPVVVPALVKALRDRHAPVRKWAATALGTIGDRRAVEELAALLDDSDKDVRLEVIRSLRRLADPRALDPLESHGGAAVALDLDERREALAAALALTDDDAGTILDMMTASDPQFRVHLAQGLGALGTGGDIPRISALLRQERNWRVRRAIRSAVASIRRRARSTQ